MSLLDENTSILQRLAERGDDMHRARPVDFAHIFTDRSSAERFADRARQAGFRVNVVATEDGEAPWDVIVTKEMVPSPEEITSTEASLDALARNEGGQADGWGFFQV
ncbi:ribonuclease E inhibitor RraB [Sphingopyxis sp. BSN-002]|uniref:ribonuclease E inhibitor RraB n=1 Tax=Sphingopyxis sp. BSN-002 TaxID=2911495 RepID=UPI001EDB50AD|nr:ribonuclease E inhibitor RraB [Sphingopyxis sp. BSN-002]UKK85621.1 ribonuclease E inhibitor RraB [Sphingopyxis sp. BSN-002]